MQRILQAVCLHDHTVKSDFKIYIMDTIMQFFQAIFGIVVIIFTILNLFSMGLQVHIPDVFGKLKDPKFLILVFIWGWVLGPSLGYLITLIIPLSEPYAIVMLLACLAPCAPFMPPMVDKAHGDISFAGAFIPVVAVGTVIFMPLLAPVLIKGIAISAVALAKPLIITILIPLIIGAIIRTYSASFADKIFKPFKLLAGLSTAVTVVLCLVLYGKAMVNTAGSFALLSMTLFMLIVGLLTYRFGFGLKQTERSVMSLGMGTRNIAAVFAGVLAIPNGDPRMLAMVVLWVIWSFILALIFATVFGKQTLNISPIIPKA
jgi:bile acid:Na+ symporter, BASS family